MYIMGRKTRLRAIESADAPLLREMINDPAIEEAVGGWGFPVSESEQLRWIERQSESAQTKRFMIDGIGTSDPSTIGMIYFTDLDWKNRSAEMGIKLATDAPRRQGYATDAVHALLTYLFDELQMNRVSMVILATNAASVGLFEKCGAVREGTLRRAVYKKGRYIDAYVYGILKDEYKGAPHE